MNTESHIKSTGGAGKEVHEFLDQFFALYRIDHRVILHHKIGMRLVGLKFGTDAIPIAEKHIRDDWNGEIPEGPDDLSFYRDVKIMSYFSVILKKNKFHIHCWSIRNTFSLAHCSILGIE